MHSFPRAAVPNCRRLASVEHVHSPTVVESVRLRSESWQVHAPLEGLREESVPCAFLASGACQHLCVPRLVGASLGVLRAIC